jgi:hypothetical protein
MRAMQSLTSPGFTRRLGELSPAADRVWLTGMTTGLVTTFIAAFAPLPATGGQACAYAGLLIRSALYLWSGEVLADRGGVVFARLFRLGLVAGLFELLVDWALVHGVSNGRLDYLGANDVVLLASPISMPVAWACVVVELGYPAVRLFGYLRRRLEALSAAMVTSVAIGIGAGVTVGSYEYLAFRAGWWKYAPAHAMIGPYCATFVPVAEALEFLAILPVAARSLSRDDRPIASAIEGGVSFAAAIAVGTTVAYALLELGRTP